MAEQNKGLLSWYLDSNLVMRILVALGAGTVAGVFLAAGSPAMVASYVGYTKFFGDIFVRLLQMIIVPTIFFSLIVGAGSLDPARLGRVGAKTIAYYLVGMLIAITIGLTLASIFEPGKGMELGDVAKAAAVSRKAPPMSEVLLAIVPTNPFAALNAGAVLPVIFFAMCFGIALSMIRHSPKQELAQNGDKLFGVLSAAAETMYKIVGGVMQYAPIGVFVLMSNVFAQNGPKIMGPIMTVALLIYVCFALHFVIGFGGPLTLFGMSFVKFCKGSQEAIITAFVTRSSNATLPITMRVAEDHLGISRAIAAFTLPLGATINMAGTAIYLSVTAVFIGFAVNQPLGFEQKLQVMLTATLGAIGAAGVPGAGAIMLLLVLETVGLKVEAGTPIAAAYAIIFAIDVLLDMGRTCLNVTGDIVGAAIVSKTEKDMDLSKWE